MSILITERAKSEINRIVEEQKNENNNDKKQYLRVRVVGGGCSGFQYKLTMDEEINEKLDELYEINEVSVIIDKRSMMYINGATIDYLDDMNERGFKVVNPIAKSTCGCGSSFNL
jgi:iron-sulfur cluster assembly accessory protein